MSTEAAAAPSAAPSFARRDHLLSIERQVQSAWDAAKVFNVEAGPVDRNPEDKYLATFPYPYMNGVLHLGHAFTFAKVDFQAYYQRLKGKNVLFPFGFHCTGMPIAACADKLKREIATFGNPPKFPEPEAPKEDDVDMKATEEEKKDPAAVKKGKSNKSKTVKKTGNQIYQWNILRDMGVKEEDIPKFQDARFWLRYFPPIAETDLKNFGVSSDFRRSFITTDLNPYYDSFIRWQFNRLRKMDKIAFGGRLCIFSPIDNQACADHDRSEGEGADMTEYTLIKLALQEPYPEALQAIVSAKPNHKVILPAATLRPETMYGQTNAWLLPEGEYGVYVINDKEIFVCSQRSALNMSYQHLSTERGKPEKIGTILGSHLIGQAVKAPYAKYEKVYILPLTTIKMDKGTGVVTSVPSDAPDDWAALNDLRTKQAFREKYGLKDEQVLPFEVVQIIETPGLGMQPAVDLCIEKKVASQNDRAKLDEIKEKVYKEGFAKGIMRVGAHAGQPVSVAKPIIKQEMINAGLAYAYSEPDRRVVSRSGNECVCAIADQWYLKYGEEKWQELVRKHVETSLETYNPQAKKDFLTTIGWLHEWALSRSYGLGTFLPWDPQYVIESLSDSTIYMAYYTIAHHLQQGTLEGSVPGPAGVKPEQLTDAVWDYIFCSKEKDVSPEPPQTDIPLDVLNRLRNDFEYWYPMNLRVSGKDLINNHLTMSLYNHAAIWPSQPDAKWPRSFFTNGHVMVNSEKMSKSMGNFITLAKAIEDFGADATRFALADAGDSLEDANFETQNANAAILKLTKEEEWIKKTIEEREKGQLRTGPFDFFDTVFENEMNRCIKAADEAYANLSYRDALKYSFHQLSMERDNYRLSVPQMHADLVERYLQVSIILLSPICPHWAQRMWEHIGANKTTKFVLHAKWPVTQPVNDMLARQVAYLRDTAATCRKAKQDQKEKMKKNATKAAGKGAAPKLPTEEEMDAQLNSLKIYVAASYPEWQKKVIFLVRDLVQSKSANGSVYVPERKEITLLLKDNFASDKKLMENANKFAQGVVEDLAVRGMNALETESPFSEIELLKIHEAFIVRGLNLASVEIKDYNTVTCDADALAKDVASMQVADGAASSGAPQENVDQIHFQAARKALPGRPSPYYLKA